MEILILKDMDLEHLFPHVTWLISALGILLFWKYYFMFPSLLSLLLVSVQSSQPFSTRFAFSSVHMLPALGEHRHNI